MLNQPDPQSSKNNNAADAHAVPALNNMVSPPGGASLKDPQMPVNDGPHQGTPEAKPDEKTLPTGTSLTAPEQDSPLSKKRKRVKITSHRCLDRHPSRKKSTPSKAKVSRWPSTIEIARYDDAAMRSTWEAYTSQFIIVNRDLLDGCWQSPCTERLLHGISQEMRAQPIMKMGCFADLLPVKNSRLIVGIVGDVDGVPLEHVRIENPQSSFAGETVAYRTVPLIVAAPENADKKHILVTDDRWAIGRRKCNVLRGTVEGPYLVVATVENSSGLTLRVRFFPVWLASDFSTFAVVRSAYERAAMECIHLNGGVAFTPLHKEQLARLQAELGRRWAGDLGTYPCLPDIILCPTSDCPVAILEIYGLCTLKKYSDGRKKKEVMVRRAQAKGAFLFLEIEAKHLGLATPAKDVIKMLINEWYRVRPNFLWRQSDNASKK